MAVSGIVIGLGNPEEQYRNTRHNFGWLVLDAVLHELVIRGENVKILKKPKGPYYLWSCGLNGADWLFCKPLTYMNASGEAVAPLVRFYQIIPENIFVLQDELDLPFGRMRLKQGGGAAGHNGLKSIISHLGSSDFCRLRLGIGKPEENTISYVLNRFKPEERNNLDKIINFAAFSVLKYIEKGFDSILQEVNSFHVEQ